MSDTPSVLASVEYGEVCQTVRHYSNMRWLMFPVFLVVNAALYEGTHALAPSPPSIALVQAWIPSALAILFIEIFRRLDGI